MHITEVESSMIDGFEYLEASHDLILKFAQGDLYRYDSVPPFVVDGFKSAESKGRYFNRFIRDRYQTTRIT